MKTHQAAAMILAAILINIYCCLCMDMYKISLGVDFLLTVNVFLLCSWLSLFGYGWGEYSGLMILFYLQAVGMVFVGFVFGACGLFFPGAIISGGIFAWFGFKANKEGQKKFQLQLCQN